LGDLAKTIGDLTAGFVPEGPLRTLVILVYGLCVVIAPFIYKYYLGVLAQGAKPEGSIERQDYDRLRANLAGGNLAARLYAKWLTKFLDWVERFFGDAGMADRTLFPHVFWLNKPAPLWTPPAFDRCLLLALIYPIATIFFIWILSGHVGPAEAALQLQSEVLSWQRALIAAAILLSSCAIWGASRIKGRKGEVLAGATIVGLTACSVSTDTVIGVVLAAVLYAVSWPRFYREGYRGGYVAGVLSVRRERGYDVLSDADLADLDARFLELNKGFTPGACSVATVILGVGVGSVGFAVVSEVVNGVYAATVGAIVIIIAIACMKLLVNGPAASVTSWTMRVDTATAQFPVSLASCIFVGASRPRNARLLPCRNCRFVPRASAAWPPKSLSSKAGLSAILAASTRI